MPELNEKKNILVSMTAHMGDFIWATSAFALLKKTYPRIKITVLAGTSVKELIENNPVIDEVIYAPYDTADFKSKLRKVFWALKNIPKIFLKRFDAAFILDYSRASVLISKLAFIPEITGGDLFPVGRGEPAGIAKYFTRKVSLPKDQDNTHMSVDYQTVIKTYFNIQNNAMPVLPPEFSTKNDKSDRVKIVICPRGAINKANTHIWDLENFSEIIDSISQEVENIDFYLTGTKAHFNDIEKILSKTKYANARNIAGKTSLSELTSLLGGSRLLISADTGTIHLAAYAKTDTIVLRSYNTPPIKSMPMSHKAYVFCKDIDCKNCAYGTLVKNKPCPFMPNPKCMAKITPHEVAQKAVELLKTIK
ncbi:MAG: glycosyltransferase family 9 protein [Endomicrobium sp.]|jgi:heptosyltransferase-2|nr:glycosyltransferase family 9 protein [Endomicrobium sp.]